MKISTVTLAGFRGFNVPATVEFGDRITIIYGPNSMGKTSISEGLEWLLYGSTAKVDTALSKEEFRGCYTNLHWEDAEQPWVQATVTQGDGSTTELKRVLGGDEQSSIFLDGSELQEWPFCSASAHCGRPFVLQHALKDLLIAKPDERFQRFSLLLGLNALDALQKSVYSLCTKPEARIPVQATEALEWLSALEERLTPHPSLASIVKQLKKATNEDLAATKVLVEKAASKYVPDAADHLQLVQSLKTIQSERRGQAFQGSVRLTAYRDDELASWQGEWESVRQELCHDFVERYLGLASLGVADEVRRALEFAELGLDILSSDGDSCPFCGQVLDAETVELIRARAHELSESHQTCKHLVKDRATIAKVLTSVRSRLDALVTEHVQRPGDLLNLESQLPRLADVLGEDGLSVYTDVAAAVAAVKEQTERVAAAHSDAVPAIGLVAASLDDSREESELLRKMAGAIAKTVSEAAKLRDLVSLWSNRVSAADVALRKKLDAQQGILDIACLLDILENERYLEKAIRVRTVIANLKNLKKSVDDFVADKVHDEIQDRLTTGVMEWYDRIRTVGDPDVHFSGFQLPRKTTGDVKARRVQIGASSYGKSLVSAVSCLSESKLNALGLAVCLADATTGTSPYQFIVVDDPIQSWDMEHAGQFVDVIRRLLSLGRQVILLSHSLPWVKQVRKGLFDELGRYYEITQYSKDGPSIQEVDWATTDELVAHLNDVVQDRHASSLTLMHAEDHLRVVFAQLACDIALRKSGDKRTASKLNAVGVRSILTQSGVDHDLVNRVYEAYTMIDPAHHAEEGYAPDRQRVLRYLGFARELQKVSKGP